MCGKAFQLKNREGNRIMSMIRKKIEVCSHCNKEDCDGVVYETIDEVVMTPYLKDKPEHHCICKGKSSKSNRLIFRDGKPFWVITRGYGDTYGDTYSFPLKIR